jgi:nitrite reductase (NO-forming)
MAALAGVRTVRQPTDMLAGFLLAGVAFGLAAAGVRAGGLATGWGTSSWLALHLAFVGGVSILVVGAAQFFATAYLATDPPPRRLTRAQLALWIGGTLLVAWGVPTGRAGAAQAGALALVLALALFVAALRSLERRSLQRAAWAVRWYYACAAFLALGVPLGAELARGATWASGDLLAAHIVLNVLGWFGTAIVGTVHTLVPSLVRAPLARPRLQGPTFVCWVGGVALLAAGYGSAISVLAFAGLLALNAAALGLLANVLATARLTRNPPGLPGRLVVAGQCHLAAGMVLAAALAPIDPAEPFSGELRAALAALLAAGWLAPTVMGSLLHLLGVVARARGAPAARAEAIPLARLLPALLAGAAATLALAELLGLDPLRGAAATVLVGSGGLLAAAIVARAASLVRAPRGGSPPGGDRRARV